VRREREHVAVEHVPHELARRLELDAELDGQAVVVTDRIAVVLDPLELAVGVTQEELRARLDEEVQQLLGAGLRAGDLDELVLVLDDPVASDQLAAPRRDVEIEVSVDSESASGAWTALSVPDTTSGRP
jgi:hypothetical protein